MRNPPSPYKHAGENDMNYSRSADSSLLAKRRNYAAGGSVYPIQGASGSARWMGAGPEYYPQMRAEMSPSDFATFKSVATPEQYNEFMGISSPAAATPAAATPEPAQPQTPAGPTLPTFNAPVYGQHPQFQPHAPMTLTPGVARPPPDPIGGASTRKPEEFVIPPIKGG